MKLKTHRTLILALLLLSCSREQLGLKSAYLQEYKLKKYETGKIIKTFTYAKDRNVIKIEKISGIKKASADKLISDGLMEIRLIYADGLSPYPGEISNKIVTDPKMKPVFKEIYSDNLYYSYVLLYTNERFGLGVKSLKSASYKSIQGYIYSESSQLLYKVSLFTPLEKTFEEMEETFLSLKCD
ncbi:MAG: hypothetical protein JW871_04050 [Endomicrobiales bacterium]|nr:hypothetical protein [Endomicrobiales bacterium]